VFLEDFPLSSVMAIVAVVVIVLFFVTSSDSASFVIDMLTAGGDLDPPRRQRIFWATTEGVVAAVLLLTGGLQAMQTFQLITGLPLGVILLAMCVALYRALVADVRDVEGLADVADKATRCSSNASAAPRTACIRAWPTPRCWCPGTTPIGPSRVRAPIRPPSPGCRPRGARQRGARV
jgi:choline-glycine betaine transporter